MRHASFFSGVGGLDLGFERAGIHTVSVSEIDPYACAVLAERFPDAPNLGSITEVEANAVPEADIWSGGFPCQDLSVAGKRAGFAGKRSSLAFTFLDLVEQRRPRWIVLENVPGLFSSNNGADFGRLLNEMEQLGYGVAWRTLDARYFGVPQRRRRVFIVASLGSDRAAEVLLECEGCERHTAASRTKRQDAARGAQDGSGIAGALTRRFSKGVNSTIDEPLIVGSATDADGVRAADGLARRLDNQQQVDTFGADTHRALQARDWKVGVSNQDIGQEGYLVGVTPTLTSPQGGGRRDEIPMTLVQAVIQDAREMANKTQNGAGFSTEDISYTLTAIDRQAVSTLSFPSRFGSNADVTENIAQSVAHSAGAPAVFRKSARAQTSEDSETWVEDGVANTLNSFDVGDVRTTHAIIGTSYDGFNQKLEPDGAHRTLRIGRDSSDFVVAPNGEPDDSLLPLGLDSHRYRCCGNGVVASVAEWIGRRLVEVDADWQKEGK